MQSTLGLSKGEKPKFIHLFHKGIDYPPVCTECDKAKMWANMLVVERKPMDRLGG